MAKCAPNDDRTVRIPKKVSLDDTRLWCLVLATHCTMSVKQLIGETSDQCAEFPLDTIVER